MSDRPLSRRPSVPPITRLSVSGYKSIGNEQSIDVAPFTILAGANSSGKSSIIQPLLLLKQTLEAAYDPGPLLLDGANVRFTQVKQLLAQGQDGFEVQVDLEDHHSIRLWFKQAEKTKRIEVARMDYRRPDFQLSLYPDMKADEVKRLGEETLPKDLNVEFPELGITEYSIVRNRCFLQMSPYFVFSTMMQYEYARPIQSTIHVPGLRGNPARDYPVSAVGNTFPGTFENYVASVIAKWQEEKKTKQINRLRDQLKQLGLTWKVTSRRIDDTRVELLVGRTLDAKRGRAQDLVSIADVGIGVSQILPVLVALLVALPGQMVYLEQPEIHLHPRAQVVMAKILVHAARRGVRVVVETHSSLILLAVQTLIAEEKLSPDLVKLHWFSRNDEGVTTITPGQLDDTGAFGDWPVDFADVSLEAEQRYLDAADAKLIGQMNDSIEN